MDPLLEHATGLFKSRLNCHGPVLMEILREGAHQLLATAIESEVDADLAANADQRDANGHRLLDDRVPTGSVCGAALANSQRLEAAG